MEDGKPNEGDTTGEEINTDVTPVERVTENYEALKAANDKVEAELLRGEELKAKIALGGKSSAGQEAPVKEETPKEYADKVMKNEVKDD